jgi:hypothetical protein
MKIIITFLFSSFLFSCGQSPKADNTSTEISNSVPDNTAKSTTDRWNFNKYLSDSSTPVLAKRIFNNNWVLKDDEPLRFLVRLRDDDKGSRPFYFRVITNSYKKADGAYAEGLGIAGYEYVKSYPSEFSNYFVGVDKFTDNDLITWAQIVMLEFETISENEYGKPIIENYIDDVKNNCDGCTAEQNAILSKFYKYLKDSWAILPRSINK